MSNHPAPAPATTFPSAFPRFDGGYDVTVAHVDQGGIVRHEAPADDADECDRCESTGRLTVTAWDDHGPYEATGGPCPDCR